MNKDTNPLPTISFAEMQATMDYHLSCPKCGRNRRNALAGDHAALNLLRSCPECWKWAIEEFQHINNPQSGPVGTALAGILEIVQDHRLQISKEFTIPAATAAIQAILEALAEDVRAALKSEG